MNGKLTTPLMTLAITVAMLLPGVSRAQDEQPLVVRVPAETEAFLDQATAPALPRLLAGHAVFYESFTDGAKTPKVNTLQAKLRVHKGMEVTDAGFTGKGLALGDKHRLQLSGDKFDASSPITMAFWWSLREDLPKNGSVAILRLDNGKRGFISVFGRGGPWAGLKETALVMQAWNVEGIKNVNHVITRKAHDEYKLTADTWHHTVMTIDKGIDVTVYMDGKQVARTSLEGRKITPQDAFHHIVFGPAYGKGVTVDDVMVLKTVMTEQEVTNYYTVVRKLKDQGKFD